MIAPAVAVAAAAAHVLAMLAVVRANSVVTALSQMALTAVTLDIVEEDGACARSALNVNAIAETEISNYWRYAPMQQNWEENYKHHLILVSTLTQCT